MRHAAHGHGGNQVAAVDPRSGPHDAWRQRQQVGGQYAGRCAQPNNGARVAVGNSLHASGRLGQYPATKDPTQARKVRAGVRRFQQRDSGKGGEDRVGDSVIREDEPTFHAQLPASRFQPVERFDQESLDQVRAEPTRRRDQEFPFRPFREAPVVIAPR